MELCDFIALCEARLGRDMTKRELKVLGRTYSWDDSAKDVDAFVRWQLNVKPSKGN